MRTKNHDWLDTKTNTPMYGIKIQVGGTWFILRNSNDGTPQLFSTEKERDEKRASLRRLKPWIYKGA